MSLPTPNTRKEQYLNAIATGNAGGLPTPITREEEYLEAIAKGGGSGEGDMKKSVYDSDLDVANAGGIKGFVNSAVAGKVDKVEGKGLSTNDYDNTEKAEVAKVAGKAEKTATASGEVLALAPTSEGKALIYTAYGMSVQDGTPTPSSPVDIESANVNLRSVGKNLIPYPYYKSDDTEQPTTGTDNGITWTINDDKSVTITGEATADFSFYFAVRSRALSQIHLKAGSYKLTGCPSGGSRETYSIYLNGYKDGTTTSIAGIRDTGNGMTQTYDFDVVIGGYIDIKSGTRIQDPITFKPMLRLADIMDDTYEPYTKTDLTTNLTLRAIEVSSTDNYNLEKDGKYYIADTLDYSEDSGFVVTRRIGIEQASNLTWSGIDVNGYTGVNSTGLDNVIAETTQNPLLTKYFQPTHATGVGSVPDNAISKFSHININTTVVSGATTNAERKTMWDTWLSTHDFDIYYILITTTTESITTEQALALLSLKTYDESTSISSQAEPSCTVAIEYAKERLAAVALIAHNLAKGNDLRIAELEETP